jgi:hypothetical protein
MPRENWVIWSMGERVMVTPLMKVPTYPPRKERRPVKKKRQTKQKVMTAAEIWWRVREEQRHPSER